MKRILFRSRRRASSLIISLLVIVILSTIVVAFMQSMSVERMVAKSSLNVYRARLAADSAVVQGTEMVRDLFVAYPDSATAWVTNMAPVSITNRRTPGTGFYYYQNVTVTNTATTLTNTMNFVPLVSGGNSVAFTNRALALAANSNSTNYVNLNTSAFGGGRLWIGTPPNWSGTGAFQVDVPWVELKDANGKVVSRYAFWIDDESFRVNINQATNGVRGSDSLGQSPAEISLPGVVKVVDTNNAATLAGNIATVRSQSAAYGGLFKLRNVNFANAGFPNLSDSLGFISTVSSSGLDVSRTGARRLNLNKTVNSNTVPSDASEILKEFKKITTAITNQAPLFGQRFYRIVGNVNSTNSTAQEQEIYLTKLAANIRDYIDRDSQPTMVMAGGSLYTGGAPVTALGSQEAWAIGKENVPRLIETLVHVPQLISPTGANTSASPWQIRIAYYFEFWNMGTTDIRVSDLGPNAYIRVANQPGWIDAGTAAGNNGNISPQYIPEDPSRDFSLPLKDFRNFAGNELVFPAGEVTVITTEPNPENYVGYFIPNTATARKMFRPGANLTTIISRQPHVYGSAQSGMYPLAATYNNPPFSTYVAGFASLPTLYMDTRTTPASSPSAAGSDYETEVVLGNDFGYLESENAAVVIHPGIFVDRFGSKTLTSQFHVRGGMLLGNLASLYGSASIYQIGDPRANNEQMQFTGPTIAASYQTRFISTRDPSDAQSAATMDNVFSLGQLPATTYFNPAAGRQWDEGNNPRTTLSLASGGSPAYYANAPLQTIGELGHIYDPMRLIASAADTSKPFSAGGGRTLRVGRPESTVPAPGASGLIVYDNNPASLSRRWTAWRLLDIFSTKDDPAAQTTPEQPVGLPGMINPNGALRDGGAAFLAALEGFSHSANDAMTDNKLKGAAFSANAYALFRNSLTNWMTAGVPFFERGELSELSAFNQSFSSFLTPSPGTNTLTFNDRGREEIFRRMAEFVTPKGNTFTVYVVGQALTELPNGTRRVDATQTRKVTFRLEPMYKSNDLDFDYNSNSSISNRFASPTNYALRVFSQTDN